MKKFLLLSVGLILLSGCGIIYQNNVEKLLESATEESYGKKPENYKIIMENGIKMTLKDPDSVQFKNWVEPYKCYFQSKESMTTPVLGWCSSVYYNAKNSFGGYVGYKYEEIHWVDGSVYSVCKMTEYGLLCS